MKQSLTDQQELLQDDLLCFLDGLDNDTLNHVCQAVVDHFNVLFQQVEEQNSTTSTEETNRFMELGEALDKVYSLAESYIAENKYGIDPEALEHLQLALDTVHDFIVNNFEEDEE